MRLTITPIIVAALLGVTVHELSAQGDLTPSQANGALDGAGNPQPSMKTLQQVEPRIDLARVPDSTGYHHTITSPGSYYLSANLDVTEFAGIRVQAEGVTIDLNGFEIRRTGGSFGHAIQVDLVAHRCTIKNGSITGGAGANGFQYGVLCVSSGFPTRKARAGSIQNVTVSGCSNSGFSAGEAWRIEGCSAHENSGAGIAAGTGSLLINCVAYQNGSSSAIFAGAGSVLRHCNASQNSGQYGIRVGVGSTLSNCTANTNAQSDSNAYGIYTEDNCSLLNCSATGNNHTGTSGGYGIRTGDNCTLEDCAGTGNSSSGVDAYGIRCGTGSVLRGCSASENTHTGSGTGHGISTGDNSTLVDSAASSNTSGGGSAYGILAGAGSALSNCTANNNQHTGSIVGCGIKCGDGGTLKNCAARMNSTDGEGSGILVGDRGSLDQCTGSENSAAASTAEESAGITCGSNCVVHACTASGNMDTGGAPSVPQQKGMGISAGFGCSITACTAQENRGHGIRAGGQSIVKGNTAGGNGDSSSTSSAGIMADGTRSRIEGNVVTDNESGIFLKQNGNHLMLKNSASGNTTNYVLPSGNIVGPIIDVSSLTGGGDLSTIAGADHPWVNFAF